MSHRHLLIALISLTFAVSTIEAGHRIGYYSSGFYHPVTTYHHPSIAYRPVFAAPSTVVVQRPVYVAQPVVYPEPVFVETPVVTHTPTVIPAPVATDGCCTPQPAVVHSPHHFPSYTTVRYRGPLWPLGHRDKLRYRVETPYGTHKHTYRTNWKTGRTTYKYDFDD